MRSLCTTGAPLSITGVVAMAATGGMHVVEWGTRYVTPATSDGENVGGVPGSIRQIPGFGHHRVQAKCGDSTTATQFDVSVSVSQRRGTMSGVSVMYGDGQKVTAQFSLAMCADKTCAPVGD